MKEMDETVINEMKTYMLDGNFEEAIRILKKNPTKIKKNGLNKILACCCQASTNCSIKHFIKADKIIGLLQFVLNDISKLDDKKSLDVYLRTLYFVLQLFIEKRDCQSILQLKPFLCIKVLNPPCKDVENVYKNLEYKLLNYIANDYVREGKDISTFISLSELLIELVLQVETINVTLEKYVHYCFRFYHSQNPDLHTFISIDNNICKLALSKLDYCDEDVFFSILQLILNVLRSMPTLCMRSISHIIKIVLNGLHGISGGSNYEITISTLQKFNLILCDFESLPDEKKFCDIIKECGSNLKKLATYNFDSLQVFVQLICTLLKSLNTLYKPIDLKFWKTKITSIVESSFITFLRILNNVAQKFTYKCLLSDCKMNHGISALYNLNVFKMNILKKTDVTNEHILNCANKIISLIDRNKIDCKYWSMYASQFVVLIYNLSMDAINTKACEPYLIFFIKLYFKYKNKKDGINESLVTNATAMLCMYYIGVKDYENTLAYSAIGMLLWPNDIETFSRYWIKSKYEVQHLHSNLQHVTVLDIINKYDGPLKEYLPSLNLMDRKRLLHTELAQYIESWPSKASMTNVCKQLESLEDLNAFTKTLTLTWIHSISLQNKDLYSLVGNTLQRLKNEANTVTNINELLYQSLLKYIAFKCSLNEASEEIKKEIDKNKDLLESNKSQENETEFEDKKIYCLYNCLKLVNHFEIMNNLIEFLNFMESFAKSDSLETRIGILQELNVCKFLINAAFDFRLQNYSVEMLQCWYICLKFAKILQDHLTTLTCISFIMESSNRESDDATGMIVQAEDIIKELEETPENVYTIVTYYINVTCYYLMINKLDRATEYFTIAKEMYPKSNNKMLKGRFDYLNARFFMLPCGYYNFEHDYASIPALYISFLSHSNDYRKQNYNVVHYEISYINCLIMEIITELCSLYSLLKLPRELYCYGKLIVYCAMEQVVPLRVAYILYHLTMSDHLCVKLDEWQSKLEGINNLLCLTEPSEINEKDGTSDVDLLCDNFQQIFLDCPSIKHQYQPSCSSPKFTRKNIRLPSCIQHSTACTCFFCFSIEYQELTLMKLNSEAVLSIYQGENEIANQYFSIILRIYDIFIAKKKKWQDKVNDKIEMDVVKYSEAKLHLIYCKTLALYRDNYIRSNSLTEAINLNRKLIRLLENIKHLDMYLYNDAQFNELAFKMRPTIQILPEDDTEIEERLIKDDVKTPENKTTTIVIDEPITDLDVTPRRRIIKTLKFDLGNPNEISPNNCVTQFLTVSDTNKKKESKSNKKNNNSKLKIFEDPDYLPTTPESAKQKRLLSTATSLLTTRTISSIKAKKENDLPTVRKNLFSEVNVENSTSKKRAVKTKKTTKVTAEIDDISLRRSTRNRRL